MASRSGRTCQFHHHLTAAPTSRTVISSTLTPHNIAFTSLRARLCRFTSLTAPSASTRRQGSQSDTWPLRCLLSLHPSCRSQKDHLLLKARQISMVVSLHQQRPITVHPASSTCRRRSVKWSMEICSKMNCIVSKSIQSFTVWDIFR